MKTADPRNWQININDPATIVEGADDIAQCIYIIMNTVPGSDPLRPTFGSNIYKHLDRPINEVQPMLIYDATTAIEQWEKRITVNKCTIAQNGADGRSLNIEATVVASAAQITLKIKI